jgi:hypothetical protein
VTGPVPAVAAPRESRRQSALRRFLPFGAGLLLPASVLLLWASLWPPEVPVPGRGPLADMVFCPSGVLRRSVPYEEIPVEGFFIDRFETTRGEFARFLAENPDVDVPPGPDWEARRPRPGEEELPVSSVSLFEAEAYARDRGKRLPRSEEWEWAARGPQGLRFPWGDADPASLVANVLEAGIGGPTPVGLFESGRSRFGVYDLVGNVAEWTSTPVPGPFTDARFVRGGSFADPVIQRDPGSGATVMDTHRPAARGSRVVYEPVLGRTSGPRGRSTDRGFRCVLGLAEGRAWAEVHALAQRLGARDPWRYLRITRPALLRIEALGQKALRPLSSLARETPPGVVRDRLLALVVQLGGARGGD